jgi:hypothetical protein
VIPPTDVSECWDFVELIICLEVFGLLSGGVGARPFDVMAVVQHTVSSNSLQNWPSISQEMTHRGW